MSSGSLFPVSVLHQTTTGGLIKTSGVALFPVSVLHQTTTPPCAWWRVPCCFPYPFYIKPQLAARGDACRRGCFPYPFYIKPQHLHSAKSLHFGCFPYPFYIKPQQPSTKQVNAVRCFPYPFYIKPQRIREWLPCRRVVSHIRSTSNHNSALAMAQEVTVVSHIRSTSNHNSDQVVLNKSKLFPISVLHQTTT